MQDFKMVLNRLITGALGIIFVMILGVLPANSYAAIEPEQATIVIDVTGPDDAKNYAMMDKFNETQTTDKANFFAIDEDDLVLSETPVYRIYVPVKLADLGITFNSGNEAIAKSAKYSLASYAAQSVPSIPELDVTPKIYVADNNKHIQIEQAMLVINDAVNDMIERTYQLYRHALLSSAAVWKNVYQQASASVVVMLKSLFWLLALLVLIRVGVLIFLRAQKMSRRKKVVYKGALGVATEMVGNGIVFAFDGKTANGSLLPSNTIYLRLMWNVMKFTTDGSAQTYFYMTYYFPPQHGYASPLQKPKILSHHKSYINV